MYAPPRSWFRGRLFVLGAGGVTLALAATLAFAMSQGVGAERLGEVDAGFETAPDFTLPTFDGGSVTLSEYADGPVFVYFWASWCGPCYREAPLIERLWPEYEAAGHTFLAVNILDREEDARAFIEEFGLTFPNVIGGDSMYLEYGVYGLPEAFFVRPGMVLDTKFIGELAEPQFREMLAASAGR